MSSTQTKPVRENSRAVLPELDVAPWRRWFSLQAPFRWHLRSLDLGYTLDVGCGDGQELMHLDGHGVGIEHDPALLARARQRGCLVLSPQDFLASSFAREGTFDSLLIHHILERIPLSEARDLIGDYLPSLRPGGKLLMISRQEAGHASEKDNVEFMTFARLRDLYTQLEMTCERTYSFPLPRFAGRFFRHNEFVAIGTKAP